MTEPHWGMLDRRPKTGPDLESREWAALHMRLFSSPDGKEWLEKMWADKCGTPVNANVPDSYLRWLEAQRQMLRDIERLTAKGLDGLGRPEAIR